MSNEITDNILDFILGGNSTFAIVQDETGSKGGGIAWYNVSSKDGRTFFVSGIGAGQHRIYCGYFSISELKSKQFKEIRVGKKQPEGNVDCKPLVWLLRRLMNDEHLPSVVHVISDGRCAYCRRELTDLESIHRGLGPKCYERVKSSLGRWDLG